MNHMKVIAQAATSVLALAGLLYGTVAQATNLAELPLKSSIYIKPNVIIGLDDSGSMAWEVLIKGDQGTLQWKYNATTQVGTAWDAGGNFLPTGGTDLAYLWPSSIESYSITVGGVTVRADQFPNWSGVPPTPQFASVRSSDYHKLYYNPAETYAPWSPAYVSGLEKSYANVSTANALAAVRSVKAPLQPRSFTGTTQELLQDRWFGVQLLRGMRVPGGGNAYLYNSGSDTWSRYDGASYITTSDRYALLKYYPATYWVREACTADGETCVAGPEAGAVTLKRYEIKRANYPTDAAYITAIQNFANWYTYYRKRTFMLNAAMGKVLENLGGLRMGVVRFNNMANVTMYDLDSSDVSKNGRRVAGIFYDISPNGGTPTRENLKYIGEQYKRTTDATGQPLIQYACQRNNAFIVTDGFYNAGSRDYTVPAYNRAKYGAAAPYSATYANTMADLALYYYTTNPRPPGSASPLAEGRVPEGKDGPNRDTNPNLHVNTYALTLNVHGNLWPGIEDPFTAAITWPDPAQVTGGFENQPHAIDDLWHATINGRGQMYLATSPADTAKKISDGFADILSQVGSQGGVALGAVNLTPTSDDNFAYMANYNPSGWSGDLTAHRINVDTGAVTDAPIWQAGKMLLERDWTTRLIIADKAGGAVAFTNANVGTIVNPDTADFPVNAEVVDYLRGKRDGEGTKFRTRTGLMGAIINAEPALDRVGKVVYIASGEGMLHAFDTSEGSRGKELWAFVPREVLGTTGASPIGNTVERAYSFKTLLDATPIVTTLGAGRLLVSGMGAGGRSYFALDVSNPRAASEVALTGMVKWNFTDPAMGYTVGKPVAVNTVSHGRVVLVTSGYDNGVAIANGGRGRMWMLNANTGAVIKVFKTQAPATGEAGLAQVSAFVEPDGMVRYVYGGDLTGALYRFDLEAAGADIDGSVIAYLKDSLGRAQPVTTAPELSRVGDKRVVLVGTGRLLDSSDFGATNYGNSFYAIADGPQIANTRAALVDKAYTRNANVAASSVNTAAVNWSTQRGWYMDLPTGEHANTTPVIVFGMVVFVTNVNSGSSCEASSYLYRLDVGSGNVGIKDSWVSQLLSNNVGASRAVALRTAGNRVVVIVHKNDDTEQDIEVLPKITVPGSRNAWREVINETVVGDTP
jgi:type IV pilus assembly protein PilY1